MKSIIPGNHPNRCYLCHRYGNTQTHHMLHGIRRKAADKYGLTVYLCADCHRELHDHGRDDLYLEQVAQEEFELRHGHDKFLEVFGKNYL